MTDLTRTILIADDDELLREALVDALHDEGDWRIVEARDGAEAMTLALSEKPDVLVIDQRMPGLTGCEVVLRMRAGGLSPPTILITAARDARTLATDVGLRCYLSKPFSLEDFTAMIACACAGEC